jgi:hypothetical protein
MSPAKRGGRFNYLTSETESTQPKPTEKESGQESTSDSLPGRKEAPHDVPHKTDGREGGEEGRGQTSSGQELTSVPKGQGRMKQKRSQLNVRIPTTLKRQASAKAVLEGRDIGEVVEELLREYLDI